MPYPADQRSVKVDTNEAIVAYHVIDGPVVFQYKADARAAVAHHPLEWSMSPWDREGVERGRKHVIERHKRETASAEQRARAKEIGAPMPLGISEEDPEFTEEDQAALDEHMRAVEEANERLKAYHEKKAAERAEADQAAADEALVRSIPPRPTPTVKRPFGRKGEPTPAEIEMLRKRDEQKAADDKVAADKAEQDRIESSGATQTF